MDPTIGAGLAIAGVTILAAIILGYRAQKSMGAILLGAGATMASAICIVGTLIGQRLRGSTGGWLGLILSILLTGFLAWRVSGKIVRSHQGAQGRSGQFVAGMWFGYTGLCIFGYLAGDWLGLLTITLPSLIILWVGLYRISAYILPLDDPKQQRAQAFKSLMTFTMSTNFPFYVLRDGEREERVPGNVYSQFFAGPGVVLADCDQAGYRTDGIKFLGIAEPGLTFTGMFEQPPKPVDLRPQLRAFHVDALTKDGIPIRVLIFFPFRIQCGKGEIELGKPFPFRRKAIFEAITQKPVERTSGEGDQQELEWNIHIVPMIATRIMQDIISNYKFDELCAADDPDRDPRFNEIIPQMKAKVTKAMMPYGIEVLGGGISNILPADRSVLDRRIENWRTEWVRQMYLEYSAGTAERDRQIEEARAEAEADVVMRLGQVVEQCLAEDRNSTEAALALRFIDCVGEMVSETENQWPPPPDLEETLIQLRGKLARDPSVIKASKGKA